MKLRKCQRSPIPKKTRKDKQLYEKKRDIRITTCLSTGCLRKSSTVGLESGLSVSFTSTPSAFAGFTMPVPCLSTPSASAGSFGFAVPMSYLSALSSFVWFARSVEPVSASCIPSAFALPAFTLSTSTGSAMLMSNLSVLSTFVLSVSALFVSTGSIVPMFCFSAPSTSASFASVLSAFSKSALLLSSLSTSTIPVFELSVFSGLVVTPTPKKQKLIEFN